MKPKASWDQYDIETFHFFPVGFKPQPSRRKPNHIVWIVNRYLPLWYAGSECMAHVLNQFLVKKGWHVTVLAPEIVGPTFEGVHTVSFQDTEKAQKALEEASLLVSQHSYEYIAQRTAAQLNLPIVFVIHQETRIPHLKKHTHALAKSKIHLLYNSTWLERYYKERGWDLDSKVLFPPVFPKDYSFKRQPKYVGLVNCNENKGAELLIELARRMPDVEFAGILGAYGTQITKKGIPNLHYFPHTAKKEDVYKHMDIILMPSKRESWGRVAVESMSLGIPVLAHPTRGLKESLGEAGTFISRYKPQDWVEQIGRLKTDPWLYARKSMEGQARAQELDPAKQLTEVEAWFKRIQTTA